MQICTVGIHTIPGLLCVLVEQFLFLLYLINFLFFCWKSDTFCWMSYHIWGHTLLYIPTYTPLWYLLSLCLKKVVFLPAEERLYWIMSNTIEMFYLAMYCVHTQKQALHFFFSISLMAWWIWNARHYKVTT